MRFSILALLLVTAIVGVFCIALTQDSAIGALVVGFITYAAMLVSAIKAMHSAAKIRGAWAGFAAGGILYLLLDSQHFPLSAQVQPWILSRLGFQRPGGIVLYYHPAMGVLHHAICLIMGLIGAVLGYAVSKPEQK